MHSLAACHVTMVTPYIYRRTKFIGTSGEEMSTEFGLSVASAQVLTYIIIVLCVIFSYYFRACRSTWMKTRQQTLWLVASQLQSYWNHLHHWSSMMSVSVIYSRTEIFKVIYKFLHLQYMHINNFFCRGCWTRLSCRPK